MHPAAEIYFGMSVEQKRMVHIRLCEAALAVWENSLSGQVTYIETVTGSLQTLDWQLPREALASIRAGNDLALIQSRYHEPIVALHDEDLVLPDKAEFAFYAIYNAFRLHVMGDQFDSWLIVNQALATVEPEARESLFLEAVNSVV